MRATKRDVLLTTAERLFYEEGFHATGIDRVVSEAGIARMTLYNHFPSKEALVEAVLERRYERYLADLRRAMAEKGANGATVALARCHGDWLAGESRHGCIVTKAIGEFERHHGAIAELGRRLKRELLALVREALVQDGHAADTDAAERVLVVLEGANALVPVIGADNARQHLHALLGRALHADSATETAPCA